MMLTLSCTTGSSSFHHTKIEPSTLLGRAMQVSLSYPIPSLFHFDIFSMIEKKKKPIYIYILILR